MKKVFIAISLVLIFCFSRANDSTINLNLIKTYKGTFKNFETDNLGNYYLITPTNQIIKLNNNFDSVASFSNNKPLGNITSIDVSNPLKILVFYKGFSTIVVLDRFLTTINTINLQKLNMFDVSVVTSSYDNNIWLFDEIENKIKKIDNEGKLLTETVDFRLLFDYDKSFTSQFVKDFEGKLYIYSKQNGLFIFDYYGSFIRRHSITALTNAQLAGYRLIGLNKTIVEILDIQNRKTFNCKINIDPTQYSKFLFSKTQIFALNKEGLNIFSYQ